ncbi:MAG: DUF2071 domain-containing protein [Verrucomicrobiales bacterium]|nr:DUF2071 domain-containing protein [Verrucomicrobiales bacterium]
MGAFLTAEWRQLVMLNYEVDRALLEPLVPRGTVLDTYQGRAFVSVVGFLFLQTRVLGVSVPFHQDFEEVNLRFYVRRFAGDDWRRGVVFIKEIVPKAAIAATARLAYNERYVCHPMRHQVTTGGDGISASYEWKVQDRWNRVFARGEGNPRVVRPGTLDEFITEHYWGYTAQRDGSTLEYQVEHPSWRIWSAVESAFDCDVSAVYGDALVEPLSRPPASAFIADGSPVTVHGGRPTAD